MAQHSYVSRLRYLDADDVGTSPVNFRGLHVHDRDGAELGTVDGFILDADSGRVLYTVVDSGGWFTSRRLLVPIGHAALSNDRKALTVDLPKDSVRNFPEYDESRFRSFSDEELRAFESRTVTACCPGETFSADTWSYDTASHYRTPSWWAADRVPERLRPIETRPYRTSAAAAGGAVAGTEAYDRDRELVRAREDVAASSDDVSPHIGGRAQPGDVLGVETGGERTYLGETGEDENKRRRTAERSVPREDER